MNIMTTILDDAGQIATSLSELLNSLLKAITPAWFDAPDGGVGVVMSGLAGVATALLVALLVSIYLRSGYRSTRDIITHGLAAALVLGLIAFVVYDVKSAALAYLGLSASVPSAELDTRSVVRPLHSDEVFPWQRLGRLTGHRDRI